MSKETELKLRIHPSVVFSLAEALNALAQPLGNSTLNNRYLDTSTASLAKAKAALRIREKNGAYEQTLKTRGKSAAGLHQRGEWNWPLANNSLNTQLLKADDVAPHWPQAINPDALVDVFSTNFERSAWLYESASCRIEVVIDQGQIQAGKARLPLCEVELELQQGTAFDLWQLALQLSAQFPLYLSDISKAERGYRLAELSGSWSDVVNFSRNDDLSDVVPKWLQYEHQQFQRALEACIWDGQMDAALVALRHWQALRQLPQLAGKTYKRRDTKTLREKLDVWSEPLNQLATMAQLESYLRSADDDEASAVESELSALARQQKALINTMVTTVDAMHALTQAAFALYELPALQPSVETASHWLRHLLHQQAPLLQRLHDQRPQEAEQWRGRRHDMQLLRQSCDYLRAQPSLAQGLGIDGQGIGEGTLRVLNDMLNAQTLLQKPWPLEPLMDNDERVLRDDAEYGDWAEEHLMVLARQL